MKAVYEQGAGEGGGEYRSQNWKVTQTNMIYIVGLPPSIASIQILCSEQYCGQYGTISKITVKEAAGYRSECYNAYITFESQQSASLAVMALRGFFLEGHKISASYGTTKYCSSFLKYGKCRKNDCMFYHQIQPQKQIHQQDNRKVFILQQQLAKHFISKNNLAIDFSSPLESYVFPSKSSVRQSLIDQGIIQLVDTDKKYSQTETQYSYTLELQQPQNEILKRIKRAMLHKTSIFAFVTNSLDTPQYEYVSKQIEEYMNSFSEF